MGADTGTCYPPGLKEIRHVTRAALQAPSNGFGGALATEQAAAAISDLVVDDTCTAPAYLLAAQGLRPLDPEPAQARS